MIRDFGSFARRGLLADLERPAEIWWGHIADLFKIIITSEILQYSACGEANEYTNVKICNLCFFS